MTIRTALAIIITVAVAHAAQAQQRTFYGADGRRGRTRDHRQQRLDHVLRRQPDDVAGRSSIGSNGTTTIYGSDGRRVDTVTKGR